MQYRMVDRRAICRLTLLAILYIAIGMPLLHPAFHHHSIHDHHISEHNTDHLEPADEKEEIHFCPICEFLATSPFHQIVSAYSFKVYKPSISKVSFIQYCKVKTGSRPSEPRASPPTRLLS